MKAHIPYTNAEASIPVFTQVYVNAYATEKTKERWGRRRKKKGRKA